MEKVAAGEHGRVVAVSLLVAAVSLASVVLIKSCELQADALQIGGEEHKFAGAAHQIGADGKAAAGVAAPLRGELRDADSGNLVAQEEQEEQPTESFGATSASGDFATLEPTTEPPPTSTAPTTTTTAAAAEKKLPRECDERNRDTFCLNGGKCIIKEDNQMGCVCPDEFYGLRCQTRNICKTVVVNSLSGDQVCKDIDRKCFTTDKFFRCECQDDEYFEFKIEPPQAAAAACDTLRSKQQQQDLSTAFTYDNLLASSAQEASCSAAQQQQAPPLQSYRAECRKINKCLGVRCRQMSEVCQEGKCVCNKQFGYSKDPADGLCKLLDLCRMKRAPDELPICGQAKCVATYDVELFKCVCPVGYTAVKVGERKSSTQCVLISETICKIPLLNKCQHLCRIDKHSNKYRCSCLNGYKQGKQAGVDDHMCFFDEHVGQTDDEQTGELGQDLRTNSKWGRSQIEAANSLETFKVVPNNFAGQLKKRAASDKDIVIKRSVSFGSDEPPNEVAAGRAKVARETQGGGGSESSARRDKSAANGSDADDDDLSFSSMSAQMRCNMFCEENKICVLEEGSIDSYRCVCDRQGYVSIGDRCLDWCSAAEFSHDLKYRLDETCLSGLCKPIAREQAKPPPGAATGDSSAQALRAFRDSSWRPDFECDCSTSPLIEQDAETKLCKLNFDEIIKPCLPGNEGHIECAQNKTAFCSVMHLFRGTFLREIVRNAAPEIATPASGAGGAAQGGQPVQSASNVLFDDLNKNLAAAAAVPPPQSGAAAGASKKPKPKEKMYTCVCAPEKKFLVDKPRNKAKCVNECDLLSNECGRFNRMCRSPTVESDDDFGLLNLVRTEKDGSVRMNQFRRTGCECLPGFNVPPNESADFTIDDNNPDLLDPNSADSIAAASLAENEKIIQGDEIAPEFGNSRAKYMNINSRCLLDYDVVEFNANFKAPADFEPSWVKISNTIPLESTIVDSRQSAGAASRSQEDSAGGGGGSDSSSGGGGGGNVCESGQECQLKVPAFMRTEMDQLHRQVVLVGHCDLWMTVHSLDAFSQCTRYRYWLVQKFRNRYADWRRVLSNHLKETFDLMDGNIRLRVNKCEAVIRRLTTVPRAFKESLAGSASELQPPKPPPPPPPFPTSSGSASSSGASPESGVGKLLRSLSRNIAATSDDDDGGDGAFRQPSEIGNNQVDGQVELELASAEFDPLDQFALIDADLNCELTIHSASDDANSRRHARKVLLEKQLPKLIFDKSNQDFAKDYYLMAPRMLIQRDTIDQLAKHRKLFNPCQPGRGYCDNQTKCEMVDTVNFSCTCKYGFTPIGSRDIYSGDSRKEVCEDIDECLFDVCKEKGLENVSECINEIGDYKCQCNRHYVGDNSGYCAHICSIILCKHGDCRLPDEHHAFCECHDGYREADCSVLDPSVALRKANMIICGSIFTSVLLLAITFAFSLNSQLKKTKKKLKSIEAAYAAAQMFEMPHGHSPFKSRLSKGSVCG